MSLSPQAVNVVGTAPVRADLTLATQASTPPGSYNLTLKATSGSLTRTHPLALTVQGGGNISGTVSLGAGLQGQALPPLEAGVGSMPSLPPEPQAVPGELIVKLREALAPQALPQVLRAGGLSLRLQRPMGLPGAGVYRVEEGVSPQALVEVAGLEALAARVAALPGVAYAQPNYLRYPLKTPNDEYYRYQCTTTPST